MYKVLTDWGDEDGDRGGYVAPSPVLARVASASWSPPPPAMRQAARAKHPGAYQERKAATTEMWDTWGSLSRRCSVVVNEVSQRRHRHFVQPHGAIGWATDGPSAGKY